MSNSYVVDPNTLDRHYEAGDTVSRIESFWQEPEQKSEELRRQRLSAYLLYIGMPRPYWQGEL